MLSLDLDLKEFNQAFLWTILGLSILTLTLIKKQIGPSKEFKTISTIKEDINLLKPLNKLMEMVVQFGLWNSIHIDIRLETGFNC